MWWYLKKIRDDGKEVVYSYGRETREQSGEVAYDKQKNEYRITKIAKNDTLESAERLLPHFWRIIFKENCPDERLVATG